jgi:hypothetical protein
MRTCQRILVVTPELTTNSGEDELLKFNALTLVNHQFFTTDPNIFQTADRIVTSIDFISREDVLNVAGNSHWDLIVFDSAMSIGLRFWASSICVALPCG